MSRLDVSSRNTSRSRRQFLKSGVAVSAGALSLGTVPGGFWSEVRAEDSKSPNEKLNIAIVGVAGQGASNLGGVAHENIVALCDIDDHKLASAAGRFPAAKTYNDFRKMLDQKEIQAVVVSTPDHCHAVATMAAIKSGRHVYCEKPLAHDVWECRQLADAVKKYKVASQMGTQIHAGNNYRRVVEVIQSGAIGPVREAHGWVGKSWSGGTRPKETPPVPSFIHWDLWLGPAPERPYNPAYLPANWRRWWDFGTGTLGDMACHYLDVVAWALKLRHPTTIESNGPKIDPETTPPGQTVTWEYPAREEMPACKVYWYDSGVRPALFKEGKLPAWGDGVLFVGEKGMMLADYGRYMLLPEKDFAGYKPPKGSIPNSIGHHKEWILACKTGTPTTCNFDYSGALSEAVLLGNVAFRAGKKINWDGDKMIVTNSSEANALIKREYRKGWSL